MTMSEKTGNFFHSLAEKFRRNLQSVGIAPLSICGGPSMGGSFHSQGNSGGLLADLVGMGFQCCPVAFGSS